MAQVQWRGVFPALTTKFTAADEIDWEALERHLEFQLDSGVHGLLILGSLGETSTLSTTEKLVESLMGMGSAKVRAPRLQLTEAEASRVEEILADALDRRPEKL
jgi:dihydrodipicolinate synthase/N-acetylneuraminate lyase